MKRTFGFFVCSDSAACIAVLWPASKDKNRTGKSRAERLVPENLLFIRFMSAGDAVTLVFRWTNIPWESCWAVQSHLRELHGDAVDLLTGFRSQPTRVTRSGQRNCTASGNEATCWLSVLAALLRHKEMRSLANHETIHEPVVIQHYILKGSGWV